MKFCEECGAQLADDDVFCEECGAQVVSEKIEEPVKEGHSFSQTEESINISEVSEEKETVLKENKPKKEKPEKKKETKERTKEKKEKINPDKRENKRKSGPVIFLLVIIILALAATCAYLYLENMKLRAMLNAGNNINEVSTSNAIEEENSIPKENEPIFASDSLGCLHLDCEDAQAIIVYKDNKYRGVLYYTKDEKLGRERIIYFSGGSLKYNKEINGEDNGRTIQCILNNAETGTITWKLGNSSKERSVDIGKDDISIAVFGNETDLQAHVNETLLNDLANSSIVDVGNYGKYEFFEITSASHLANLDRTDIKIKQSQEEMWVYGDISFDDYEFGYSTIPIDDYTHSISSEYIRLFSSEEEARLDYAQTILDRCFTEEWLFER